MMEPLIPQRTEERLEVVRAMRGVIVRKMLRPAPRRATTSDSKPNYKGGVKGGVAG